MSSTQEQGASRAEALYFDYCARRDRGLARPEHFERLCEQHPHLAAELRAWQQREQSVSLLFGRIEPRGRPDSAEANGASARTFQAGERIGDFVLIRLVGKGGMGQVWEAEQSSMKRRVALKFLLPDRLEPGSVGWFAREARAGGAASHPNLVQTFGRGNADGIEWIAQEFVPGSLTLRDTIEKMRRVAELPPQYYAETARLIHSVASGMQAAHEAGVIHRDLKPQNVLIDARGTPRITDFGLARLLDDPSHSHTGALIGTYHYLAPELVGSGSRAADECSDVFSVGVMLYELLTLTRPFDGDSSHQICEQILKHDPPEPSVLRNQCPRDLSLICLKALEKEPARRYANMRALAEDLARHLSHEPIQARPASRWTRLRKWGRRNPVAATALIASAVALPALSAVAWLARDYARTAERNAQVALRRSEDILSLSAQKELDELIREAEELWPANAAMAARYEAWLERAQLLIEGESSGPERRPGLEDHRRRLRQLRERALERTPAQEAEDMRRAPLYPEWDKVGRRITWLRCMIGDESWPEVTALRKQWEQEDLPVHADALLAMAAPLMVEDSEHAQHGQEGRALFLVERALENASADERGMVLEALGEALFLNGRFEAGLARLQEAVEASAPEDQAARRSHWQRREASRSRYERSTGIASARFQIGILRKLHEELGVAVRSQTSFHYADPKDAWWDEQLARLLNSLEEFSSAERGGLYSTGVSLAHGWGVPRRLEVARSLRERSINGLHAREAWSEALDAIASSPLYKDSLWPGSGALVPQEGLLPLRADPNSGLWEFWVLDSGDRPEYAEDGSALMTESTGIVLVLVPGGDFLMGAQFQDPAAANYDPKALWTESPVHRVKLSPYFLSKHELTQAQWMRLRKENIAYYHDLNYSPDWNRSFKRWTGQHPMEQVSWIESSLALRQLGLKHPTEAQWEFAARAGGDSPVAGGLSGAQLADYANLSDEWARVHNAGFSSFESWNDGFTSHARVGSLAPNGLGFHDMQGNVWEFCSDASENYTQEMVRDPEMPGTASSLRIIRGGSFVNLAQQARVTLRDNVTPELRSATTGVRPARRVLP